ncbi:MAG: TolC family outer membrane protein [Gammaproteobacteria bacterium]|nr:TolC family outer membrane protein [Gammaproteobacteria bacterium]
MLLRYYLLAALFLLPASFASSEDLLSVYHAAVEGDPRLKLAESKLGIGRARQQQAAGNMLPQLRGTSSFSENRQDLESSNFSNGGRDSFSGEKYNLIMTQSLFDMPKYYHWKSQKQVSSQYAAEQVEVAQQLILDIVTGYFAVLEAQDSLALIGHEIDATESLLRQVEGLYEKELAQITEVLDVRASYDALFADQVSAESQVAITRQKLQEFTGIELGELNRLSDDVAFLVMEGALEQWIEKVVAQNASLASLHLAVMAEEYSVKEKKASRLPVVDLQMSHQKSDIGYENSARPKTTTDYIGVNVALPLFTSGVTSGRISEASQRLNMARYNYEKEYRALVNEVRDALLQTNANVRRIEATGKALNSSQRAHEAMLKGFTLGAVTSADVLDAQHNVFRTRRDLDQARYGYVLNRTRLLKASGMVTPHELVQMNQWLIVQPGQPGQ